MTLTPEQFDLNIKNVTAELTAAWQAAPPSETEILTKAIMDYQYKATTAILNSIQQINTANHNRWAKTMARLDEIEDEIKKLKE